MAACRCGDGIYHRARIRATRWLSPSWTAPVRPSSVFPNVNINMGPPQLGNRCGQMGAVPGLDHDFEQYGLGGQLGKNALMVDLDDIGAAFAQHGEHGGELAGPVDDVES